MPSPLGPARIGVTGHANLAPGCTRAVADGIRAVLVALDAPLTGVTCLARGADQVFARVVLDLGGRLEVVLPAADYRERIVEPDNRAEFDDLLDAAAGVTTMPFAVSGRDAYMAASEAVLDSVDRVIAVWDGRPAAGRGGTGDVVAATARRNVPVDVVWPPNARRI